MRAALLVTSLLAGCADELPAPPDISELARAYAAPTAAVGDPAALGDLANAVIALDTSLGRGDAVLAGSGGVLRDPAEPAADAPGLPYDLEGTGFARIRHVCPGWASHPERSAELTGSLDLAMRFELGELVPVLWGIADRCAFEVAGRQIALDGDLVLAQIDRGVLVALAGAFEVEGEQLVDGELDFVVHRDGVDYRKRLGDGHVVITIGRDGRLVVHAADGDYTCDLARCTKLAGGER